MPLIASGIDKHEVSSKRRAHKTHNFRQPPTNIRNRQFLVYDTCSLFVDCQTKSFFFNLSDSPLQDIETKQIRMWTGVTEGRRRRITH